MKDDLISRAAAIDAVKKNTFRLTFAEEQNCEGHVAWSAEAVYSDVMEGALLELPPAEPDLYEYSNKLWRNAYNRGKRDALEQKTGKWLLNGGRRCECSICRHEGNEYGDANFCSNCGTRMIKEDEDNV